MAPTDEIFEYQILDTPEEESYDRVTRIAAGMFGAPYALIGFVDGKRLWLKSTVGIPMKELPDSVGLDFAKLKRDSLIVADAKRDKRYRDHPNVVGPPHIRFSAAVPLRTPQGATIGLLAVFDPQPRSEVPDALVERLVELGLIIMTQLNLRRVIRERDLVRDTLDRTLQLTNVATWIYDPGKGSVSWGGAADDVLGPGTLQNSRDIESSFVAVHPDDRAMVRTEIAKAIENTASYEIQYRINHPQRGLRWLSGRGRPVVRDGRLTLHGVNIDITEIKQREEFSRLMTRELHHRIRNLFATIRAVVSLTRTRASSVDDYVDRISGRLNALDKAQHILLDSNFVSGSLHSLFVTIGEAYPRLHWQGEDAELAESTMVALSLALHELATNATRYGSLAHPDGRVDVSWVLVTHNKMPAIAFVWTETGGLVPSEVPETNGFGSQLIRRSIVANLGGVVEKQWTDKGLVCHLVVPNGMAATQ